MGIILNSAFVAFSITLYLFSLGLFGLLTALLCYSALGTLFVFVHAAFELKLSQKAR
ncbi:hypothetical protein SAMN04488515_0240 [Cognatiyoonia koreensis]|uniref:Uncharacterized protein n=1 Tax=Cognatiyoonia koreensis TaxID=364200 RepID=A0A1I0MUH0_9RHOB|nr:hypothetical protein [Cognatiyoonia koreensis]SEV92167.1 hypothetical protein SAMN04488515_0240 [Cognatiyoonia koreensis]